MVVLVAVVRLAKPMQQMRHAIIESYSARKLYLSLFSGREPGKALSEVFPGESFLRNAPLARFAFSHRESISRQLPMSRDFEKSEQLRNEFGTPRRFCQELLNARGDPLRDLLRAKKPSHPPQSAQLWHSSRHRQPNSSATANAFKAWRIAFHFLNHSNECLFFVNECS